MLRIIKLLKKIPIDFNQYEMREKTQGKIIGFRLIPHAHGSKTALDLGCRDGYWSEKLSKLGYTVTSIDIESNYPKAQIIDANKVLPFEDNSFDLIWSSEVLEHLDDPAFSISEMKRVLKSDGQIVMTTPNSNFWFFRLFKLFGVPVEDTQHESHRSFFSIQDIQRLLPNGRIFGFFPYILVKFTLMNKHLIDLLSPVFVIQASKL